MKCAACGYSDVKADDYRDGIMVALWNMPPNGSKPFIDVSLVKYYPGEAEPNCLIEWTDLIKANACPVCGTIKMEV